MRVRGSLIVYAIFFCVLLAAAAERSGLAAIIGAFAAGLILAKTERRAHIEEQIKPVADLFVPIFFVAVGMQVEPALLTPFAGSSAGLPRGLALTSVAIGSKLLAGLGVYQRGVDRWRVGVGMIPRGEVGLIFAGIGKATGTLAEGVYAAIVAMVIGHDARGAAVAQGALPRGVTAAGRRRHAGAPGYFFVAVDCFAMIWPLILSYVACGTIFLRTSSSLRLYGRPSMIFFA